MIQMLFLFVLSCSDIADKACDMGVILNSSDFEIFTLIKNLEDARCALADKAKPNTETDISLNNLGYSSSRKLLGWIVEEDDQSDQGDFVLVKSKKKVSRKGSKKLSLGVVQVGSLSSGSIKKLSQRPVREVTKKPKKYK